MKKTFETEVKQATESSVRITVPKVIANQMKLQPGQIVKVIIDDHLNI